MKHAYTLILSMLVLAVFAVAQNFRQVVTFFNDLEFADATHGIIFGDGTKQLTAAANTPAILSGYCGNQIELQAVQSATITGLGGVGPGDCFSSSGLGSALVGVPMPSSGTLRNLTLAYIVPDCSFVGCQQAEIEGTVTVWVNNVPVELSCTTPVNPGPLPGAGTGNHVLLAACSDQSHTVVVAAGDFVTVRFSKPAQSLAFPGNVSGPLMVTLEKK